MTSSFSVTVPHHDQNTTNRIRKLLLQQFDHTIKLTDKVLTRTDRSDVRLISSALRRLYLAFNDLKPFTTNQSLPSIEISIRSMVDALGEICYQDMAILALEDVARQKPGEIEFTVQQFINTRKEIRRKSRQTIERVLLGLSENVHRAHCAKTVILSTRQTGAIKRHKTVASFRTVADSIIESYLFDFEKSSRFLNGPSSSIEICEMDRATQRLHYAINLFSDCWISDVQIFSRSLANLQRALSRVSHCEAWIEELRKQIVESRKKRQAAQNTFLFLFSQFSELRNNHLHESLALWNAWETDQLSNKLRKTITHSI